MKIMVELKKDNLRFRQSVKTVFANAFVAGVPACSVLCAEFESDSLIGCRSNVTLEFVCKLAGSNLTPSAILTGDVWPFNISIDVVGAKLNRLSFSFAFDVVASGVGIRGRFFNGPVVLIDPFSVIFESVSIYCIFWFFCLYPFRFLFLSCDNLNFFLFLFNISNEHWTKKKPKYHPFPILKYLIFFI